MIGSQKDKEATSVGSMAKVPWIWLLLLLVLRVVRSEETRRDRWVKPDGDDTKDTKTSYQIGDTLNIEWKGWGADETEKFMESGEPRAKLYVASADSEHSKWSELLTCRSSSPPDKETRD